MPAGRLIWSEQASASGSRLPEEVREALNRRLEYLKEMPRMYAVSEDERFPGCRSFWVDPVYRVFYMVGAGSSDVYLAAIIEEEVEESA